jgi:hypothetical protein
VPGDAAELATIAALIRIVPDDREFRLERGLSFERGRWIQIRCAK